MQASNPIAGGGSLVLAFCALITCIPPSVAAAGPVLDLSRSAVIFGRMPQNFASPTQPVFVTNTGDAPLALTALSIGGANATDFAAGGTCGPLPLMLAPGAQCRVELVMMTTTRSPAERGATLTLDSNAIPPQSNVALSGIVDNGLPNAPVQSLFIDPAPDWLDFALQAVGTSAPTQTITIRNSGNLTFDLLQFSFAGGDTSDFTLTTTCILGMRFRPNDNCTGTIGFAPTAEGPTSTEIQLNMQYFGVDGFYRYSITGVGAPAGSTQPVSVVEYFNSVLDHYFITWIVAEQANLDAGNTPTRWNRTGSSFRTFTTAQGGTSPVCRYYIPPGKGDSHFFGRGTVECNATGAANPTFVLEDPQFMHLYLPVAGVCPVGTTPIYRVFSNRPDANHRYMTDKAIRDQMVAKGWLAEGDGPDLVVMCAP